MPTSAELHQRRSAAVARGVSSMIPSYVSSAGGGTMTDVDGREWIDFAAGIAVTNVGNSSPKVVEAVRIMPLAKRLRLSRIPIGEIRRCDVCSAHEFSGEFSFSRRRSAAANDRQHPSRRQLRRLRLR